MIYFIHTLIQIDQEVNMKLYADYLKERENIECKYNEYIFATYKI